MDKIRQLTFPLTYLTILFPFIGIYTCMYASKYFIFNNCFKITVLNRFFFLSIYL